MEATIAPFFKTLSTYSHQIKKGALSRKNKALFNFQNIEPLHAISAHGYEHLVEGKEC